MPGSCLKLKRTLLRHQNDMPPLTVPWDSQPTICTPSILIPSEEISSCTVSIFPPSSRVPGGVRKSERLFHTLERDLYSDIVFLLRNQHI